MIVPPSDEQSDFLMAAALDEAKKAFTLGEVPIGCVIAHKGSIIARSHNLVETSRSVLAHAEIRAIQEASQVLGNWRLTGCTLCVTLEPCLMCLGAIKLARLETVMFAAGDSRQGAMGSAYDLAADSKIGPALSVTAGIAREESVALLKSFFAERRMKQG